MSPVKRLSFSSPSKFTFFDIEIYLLLGSCESCPFHDSYKGHIPLPSQCLKSVTFLAVTLIYIFLDVDMITLWFGSISGVNSILHLALKLVVHLKYEAVHENSQFVHDEKLPHLDFCFICILSLLTLEKAKLTPVLTPDYSPQFITKFLLMEETSELLYEGWIK